MTKKYVARTNKNWTLVGQRQMPEKKWNRLTRLAVVSRRNETLFAQQYQSQASKHNKNRYFQWPFWEFIEWKVILSPIQYCWLGTCCSCGCCRRCSWYRRGCSSCWGSWTVAIKFDNIYWPLILFMVYWLLILSSVHILRWSSRFTSFFIAAVTLLLRRFCWSRSLSARSLAAWSTSARSATWSSLATSTSPWFGYN